MPTDRSRDARRRPGWSEASYGRLTKQMQNPNVSQPTDDPAAAPFSSMDIVQGGGKAHLDMATWDRDGGVDQYSRSFSTLNRAQIAGEAMHERHWNGVNIRTGRRYQEGEW